MMTLPASLMMKYTRPVKLAKFNIVMRLGWCKKISLVLTSINSYYPFLRHGERGQGKGKFLIFSPSGSHENARGRGSRGNRGRGNRSLHSSSVNDDRDGDSNLFYRKNSRGKIYEKSSESADNHAGQEEGRIGRQLRLLSREINEDNIVKICHQLQVTVLVFHIIIKSS